LRTGDGTAFTQISFVSFPFEKRRREREETIRLRLGGRKKETSQGEKRWFSFCLKLVLEIGKRNRLQSRWGRKESRLRVKRSLSCERALLIQKKRGKRKGANR